MIDEPGLYVAVDIDRKGNKDERFCLIWLSPDNELYSLYESREEAMSLAKEIERDADPSTLAQRELISLWGEWNRDNRDKDPTEEIEIKPGALPDLSGLAPGKHPRSEVIRARKRAMERLQGLTEEAVETEYPQGSAAAAPIDPDPDVNVLRDMIARRGADWIRNQIG